ncbi:MAG: hypothetical protein ACI9ES_000047 [Oceanospirillaceae bacterium]|jgi:hypothetical protein
MKISEQENYQLKKAFLGGFLHSIIKRGSYAKVVNV